MKEKAPLGNPFIGEPSGGRPAKDGGRSAGQLMWPLPLYFVPKVWWLS
jgi:hypothetical protein